MDRQLEERIKAVRSSVILKHAFFGTLLLQLQIEENRTIETASTDGKKLKINPEWFNSLPFSDQEFVMIHEAIHCAGLHFSKSRFELRDTELWNIACDYVVNPIIKNSGMKVPDWALYNPNYENKSPESIYEILSKQAKEKNDKKSQQNSQSKPQTNNNQGKQSGQNPPQSDQNKKPNNNPGQGQKNPGDGKPDSQNNQNNSNQNDPNQNGQNKSQQSDQQKTFKGDAGQVEKPKQDAASQKQNEDATENFKQAVQSAMQFGKMAGNIGADFARTMADVSAPPKNWRQVLAKFIVANTKNDYTWKKPNKRFVHNRVYLPSKFTQDLGKIAFVVDTSGSISNEIINKACASIKEILNQFQGAELIVLYCDTDIRGVERFDSYNIPKKLNPKGGGGTRFAPPFNWIKEHKEYIIGMCYLTDGCASFPQIKPQYPVLWLGTRIFHPPFGTFAEIF